MVLVVVVVVVIIVVAVVAIVVVIIVAILVYRHLCRHCHTAMQLTKKTWSMGLTLEATSNMTDNVQCCQRSYHCMLCLSKPVANSNWLGWGNSHALQAWPGLGNL